MAARRQREQRKRKELGTKYAFEGIVPSDLLPPVRPHLLQFPPSLNCPFS
jgi:hypothetical protein